MSLRYKHLPKADLKIDAGSCEAQTQAPIAACCRMPNHVHRIVVPDSEEGLRRAVGEAHRRYTWRIDFR